MVSPAISRPRSGCLKRFPFNLDHSLASYSTFTSVTPHPITQLISLIRCSSVRIMISVYPNVKAPLKPKYLRFSYSPLSSTHEMIQELLLSTFSLFLSHAVGDDIFKPSGGEIILANITYQMAWSFDLPPPSDFGIEFSFTDMYYLSYSTDISVPSRKHNQ